MAFPTGWTRKCSLVIQHGQVPADQSAFPVLLTEASLPSEMLVSGGANAAQSDGGDIRFSSDLAGATQLACEVVVWDQSGGKAEIWVPVSILTASDVTIYVWYAAGGGLAQPAVGASFGAEAVWDSSFLGVWHMQAASGTALLDSTTNAQVSTKKSASEPNPSAGEISNGQDFDGVDDRVDVTAASLLLTTNVITVSAWFRVDALPASDSNFIQVAAATQDDSAPNGWWFGLGVFNDSSFAAKLNFEFRGSGNWRSNQGTTALSVGTTYLAAATYDQVNIKIFLNGASDATPGAQTDAIVDATGFTIGRRHNTTGGAGDRFWDGIIDELRISSVARSANWLLTEYHNQNAPGSFVIAGSPASNGALFRAGELGTRRGARQAA